MQPTIRLSSTAINLTSLLIGQKMNKYMSTFEQPQPLPVINNQPTEAEPEGGMLEKAKMRIVATSPVWSRAAEISTACCSGFCRSCGPAQLGAVAMALGAGIVSGRDKQPGSAELPTTDNEQ
jgi:hypothetical protein